MTEREKLKGFDKLALYFVFERNINDVVPSDKGQLGVATSYLTSQANVAVIFSTISSSLAIALLGIFSGWLKLSALPLFIAMLWFAARAWAYGRCARFILRLWLF